MSPEKTNVDQGKAEDDIGFLGMTISHVTLSCSQWLLYYTECWLNTSSTLHLASKQSRSSKYLNLYFVLHKFNAHMTPVRIYGEQYAHKFCYFFWNITHRQAISPVAKFNHVLGRGFMIQQVILIFIKCLSTIRINYFTWKYNIFICVDLNWFLRWAMWPMGLLFVHWKKQVDWKSTLKWDFQPYVFCDIYFPIFPVKVPQSILAHLNQELQNLCHLLQIL